ncbi:MAG: hypothetical protein FWG89_06145 [Treponema sp.]|nr:hypothetical protein [Treponema sp.]
MGSGKNPGLLGWKQTVIGVTSRLQNMWGNSLAQPLTGSLLQRDVGLS